MGNALKTTKMTFDLLPRFGPRITRNIVRLLLTWRRLLEPAAALGSPSPRKAHSASCDVALGGMKLGSNRGQRTQYRLHAMWLQHT
jgi:hypothetical protein